MRTDGQPHDPPRRHVRVRRVWPRCLVGAALGVVPRLAYTNLGIRLDRWAAGLVIWEMWEPHIGQYLPMGRPRG